MNDGIVANFARRFAQGPEIRVQDLRTKLGSGVTVLFGASGAGKSTVLRCLAGFEKPEQGSISFDGETWSDCERRVFVHPRHRQLGFVPQDYALFPHLTVEGNVRYGLREMPKSEQRARVRETLEWLGLTGLETRLSRELSGGQRQRVALARALARRPRLLLLDEPLSALDAPTRLRLRGELRQLLRHLSLPSILVTHDRTEALALGDELVVMSEGRIIQRGPVPEVFSRPANLTVAAAVAVETVQPGRVVDQIEGLVTVQVGPSKLRALAPDLPPGAAEVYVCIRAEDVIVVKGETARSSPRNALTATVRGLAREGPMVRVELDCGFDLSALLTKQACEQLGLKEGECVLALIKAPQIHLIPRGGG